MRSTHEDKGALFMFPLSGLLPYSDNSSKVPLLSRVMLQNKLMLQNIALGIIF
jgi:hypothetical protein